MDELTITCPRCGHEASERFYGPCSSCREQLRSTLGGEPRAPDNAEYEPMMTVTPTSVALKHD